MKMTDRSPRTLSIQRSRVVVIFMLALLLVAAVTGPIGMFKKSSLIEHSSTAIGTPMHFQRSDATVTLRGLYTDTSDSVLVARLGVDPQDGARLPSKGTDYRVFLASDSLKGVQEVPVLFGRLGTDGDMFLVLPKPSDKVYTAFVMNTKYLNTSTGAGSTQGDGPADIGSGEQSVTEAMSQYSWNPNKKDGGEAQIGNDQMDIISFRMTTHPASNKSEYKPVTLDTTLLDDNGNFDFDAMFNKLFKEAAYSELSKRHSDLSANEDQLRRTASEYRERLNANPNDSQAAEALTTTENSLKKVTDEKNSLAGQINAYENLKLDDDTFSNLQTKAKVIEK